MMITAQKMEKIYELAKSLKLNKGQLNEIILMRYGVNTILYLSAANAFNLEKHLLKLLNTSKKTNTHAFIKFMNKFLKAKVA